MSMIPERPDLSGLDAEIVEYIEALEVALEEAGASEGGRSRGPKRHWSPASRPPP
ncbi:MAG: hypothetical protein R2911_07720 [Caldilineaceae bacterium]